MKLKYFDIFIGSPYILLLVDYQELLLPLVLLVYRALLLYLLLFLQLLLTLVEQLRSSRYLREHLHKNGMKPDVEERDSLLGVQLKHLGKKILHF